MKNRMTKEEMNARAEKELIELRERLLKKDRTTCSDFLLKYFKGHLNMIYYFSIYGMDITVHFGYDDTPVVTLRKVVHK